MDIRELVPAHGAGQHPVRGRRGPEHRRVAPPARRAEEAGLRNVHALRGRVRRVHVRAHPHSAFVEEGDEGDAARAPALSWLACPGSGAGWRQRPLTRVTLIARVASRSCFGRVKYGTGGGKKYSRWRNVSGAVGCNNNVFGDPARGEGKVCASGGVVHRRCKNRVRDMLLCLVCFCSL